MATFYVATLARYVLVEADNENAARYLGTAALHDLYADLRTKLGRDVPICIHTVRLATTDEIEMQRMIATEQKAMFDSMHPGDRIRLVAMHNDPDPIERGSLGTVVSCHRHENSGKTWHQIDVAWNNGRTLMLVCPPDEFEIIERAMPDKS